MTDFGKPGALISDGLYPSVIEPNKEIMALVKMVLDQNALILEMNSKLLLSFSAPMWIKPKEEK